MTALRTMVKASGRPSALDLLQAARDELNALAAETRLSAVADRLNGAAALIEEALGKLKELRP